MPAARFQPIEILEPTAEDQKKTKARSDLPQLFEVFFRLSAEPNYEWYKIFCEVWVERSRTNPSDVMLADIEGRQLKMTCELEHLPKHFKNMQSDIDTINQKYQAELDKKANP